MKHNSTLRPLHAGLTVLVTVAGATLHPAAANPSQTPVQPAVPSPGRATVGAGVSYTQTSLSTAMLSPSLKAGNINGPQAVLPRWSVAETPPSSRISLVMSSLHGAASFHSQVVGQHSPVASYPLAFGTGIASLHQLVAVTGTTARPLAAMPLKVTTQKAVLRIAPNPNLAARHAMSHQGTGTLLAELDAEERRLDSADAYLSEGQRQLASFGDTMRQAMLEAGPDATGLNPFVRVAQRYAGTPYVWGGESARGFDCSGFIIRVMRDLGYQALPHSAAEQFTYGKPIAQELLKPGDLVFFANTYKPGISHVGIYLGQRRFIHAAGTGKGTIVSSLDAGHFQAHYAGARRLIAARG